MPRQPHAAVVDQLQIGFYSRLTSHLAGMTFISALLFMLISMSRCQLKRGLANALSQGSQSKTDRYFSSLMHSKSVLLLLLLKCWLYPFQTVKSKGNDASQTDYDNINTGRFLQNINGFSVGSAREA